MNRREPSLDNRRRAIAMALGAALAAALATPAHATICKYIDADGNVVYSNVPPGKGLRKLSCEIVDEAPRRAATGGNGKATPAPGSFPRVEPATQRGRDEMRRKVLEDELKSEEKLLGEARDAYDGGAPPPLADEKSDAEKYRQRIGRLRQAVQVHERNVEALRKELAATR